MHLRASANSPGTFCDKARVFVFIFNLPLLVSVITSVLVEPSSQQTADGCRKLELVLFRAWNTKVVKGKSRKLQLKYGSLFASNDIDLSELIYSIPKF